MELSHLNGQDLIKYLPHRGRNLLLDTVDRSETPKGPQAEISLEIRQPDPAGRDIFLEKDLSGNAVYSPYMFSEFLALGSIVLLTDLPPGTIAYFSTITNYKRHASVPASGPLRGTTVRNKDRGLFKRFTGKILDAAGGTAAETDIMAFAFNPDEESDEAEKKITEKPAARQQTPIDKSQFSWKPAEMVFVDEIADLNLAESTGLFRYTYPQDHPFVEGHFPGNPVMMGITQWIGCADAITCLAHEIAKQEGSPAAGKEIYTVCASVEMIRPDGTVACEVKNLKLNLHNKGKESVPYAELIQTKRVGFRDIVRPNDVLFFKVFDFSFQE